jgi:sarcosine oxidase delta subunit
MMAPWFLLLGFLVSALLAVPVWRTPLVASEEITLNASMKPQEKARLRRQFQGAQARDLQLLKKRHQEEFKVLQQALVAREKEWTQEEQEKRREFFRENPEGPKRRDYIKDYRERWKGLRALLKREREELKAQHRVREESLKQEHREARKRFEAGTSSSPSPQSP